METLTNTNLTTFSGSDINDMDPFFRRNLMNSFPGFKSAVLIGTKGENGQENLAIFNSLIHLGAHPPLMGFILRPLTVPRHTFQHIESSGFFTVNHVHTGLIEAAHQTSGSFPADVSEFQVTGLTPEYVPGFWAPFVREARMQAGLQFKGAIPIPYNDTLLVVGEVVQLRIPSEVIGEDGFLDLPGAGTVAISGLDAYLKCDLLDRFDYFRPGEPLQSLRHAGEKS